MALAVLQHRALDASGNLITGVDIRVKRETAGQPLAALKSDREGTSAISNPTVGGFFADGKIRCHVAGGAYQVEVLKDAVVVDTFRYVAVGTAAEFDSDSGEGSFTQYTSIRPDAFVEEIADRATYDGAAAGFAVVVLEDSGNDNLPTLYAKLTSASADWSDGITWLPNDAVDRTDRLINGSGQINQRASATVADDVYGHDRWYALTQTAAIVPTTLSDVADGLRRMMRLTQSQAAAQRMGYAQIIKGTRCKDLRGQQCSFGGWLRYSNAAALRFAILEWTGAEDTVTSDVVNDWTNGTFTAGQFFNSTTLTVRAVGTITPSANTLTEFLLTATLGSTFNNLILFIWTEGTSAQNSTLDIAALFRPGPRVLPVVWRDQADEFRLCQHYFYNGIPSAAGVVLIGGTDIGRVHCNHPTRMRTGPTLSMVVNLGFYDGIAASNITSITNNYSTATVLEFDTSGASGLTAGNSAVAYQGSGGNLEVRAEL